mmetsp:Transcript_4925/g.7416  ORF Transcript_4925/g.7416 Transcript_4925/m.7416 type:complete len:150 (+) Transcript_4925:249-698(+)
MQEVPRVEASQEVSRVQNSIIQKHNPNSRNENTIVVPRAQPNANHVLPPRSSASNNDVAPPHKSQPTPANAHQKPASMWALQCLRQRPGRYNMRSTQQIQLLTTQVRNSQKINHIFHPDTGKRQTIIKLMEGSTGEGGLWKTACLNEFG